MITDLKELEKFFKICRKQGVTEITFQGTCVKFGELPSRVEAPAESDEIPTDSLTPDELIYYAIEKAAP